MFGSCQREVWEQWDSRQWLKWSNPKAASIFLHAFAVWEGNSTAYKWVTPKLRGWKTWHRWLLKNSQASRPMNKLCYEWSGPDHSNQNYKLPENRVSISIDCGISMPGTRSSSLDMYLWILAPSWESFWSGTDLSLCLSTYYCGLKLWKTTLGWGIFLNKNNYDTSYR